MATIVMSWSKCKVEIGATGANDAMAANLTNIGYINDRSTTLTTEDGNNNLTAIASGGKVIAREDSEPVAKIITRVKEISPEVETLLTGAVENEDGELVVKTNKALSDFSVKLTPKNIGATGIKARRTYVSLRPGSSEEEGQYVDVTFTILECADGELYRKFKVAASDWGASD